MPHFVSPGGHMSARFNDPDGSTDYFWPYCHNIYQPVLQCEIVASSLCCPMVRIDCIFFLFGKRTCIKRIKCIHASVLMKNCYKRRCINNIMYKILFLFAHIKEVLRLLKTHFHANGPLNWRTLHNLCLGWQTLFHFFPNCCSFKPITLSNTGAASSAVLTGVLEISRSLKMRRISAESLRLSVWSQSRTPPVSSTSTFQPDFRTITGKTTTWVVMK